MSELTAQRQLVLLLQAARGRCTAHCQGAAPASPATCRCRLMSVLIVLAVPTQSCVGSSRDAGLTGRDRQQGELASFSVSTRPQWITLPQAGRQDGRHRVQFVHSGRANVVITLETANQATLACI